MPKYEVTLEAEYIETLWDTYTVEADTQDEAEDAAAELFGLDHYAAEIVGVDVDLLGED